MLRQEGTEEFKREVELHLTRQETEPHETLYFKVYKSQLPVIEQALETATLMLGSDRSTASTTLNGAEGEHPKPNCTS